MIYVILNIVKKKIRDVLYTNPAKNVILFVNLIFSRKRDEFMSQEKVDRRKEYKKNHKQILAREKKKAKITKAIWYLCLICIIAGVGFSFYSKLNPASEENTNTFYSLIATDRYGILDPSLPE